MFVNYYDILGVSRNAGEKEIRLAYRQLAREYHPDLNPGDPESLRKIQDINLAYAVLSNPKKRAVYDQQFEPMGFERPSSAPPQEAAHPHEPGEQPFSAQGQDRGQDFSWEWEDARQRGDTDTNFFSQELAGFVIRWLKQGLDQSDVIYEACVKAGLNWYTAEGFVRRVEAELDAAEPGWRQRARKIPWPKIGETLRYAAFPAVLLLLTVAALLAVYFNNRPITWNLAQHENAHIDYKTWRQSHRVEAGQIVEIAYHVEVKQGVVVLIFKKGWPFLKQDAVSTLLYHQQQSIRTSQNATWAIPIEETGWYDLQVVVKGFKGSFEISWK